MVDINILSDNHFGILPSYQDTCCQITNDYLGNIDESDLITFTDNDTFDTSPPSDQYFIDTPPETPVNNHTCSITSNGNDILNNNFSTINTVLFGENVLDFNQNFNEINKHSPSINHQSDSDNSNNTSITTNTTIPLTITCPTILCSNETDTVSSLSSSSFIVNGYNRVFDSKISNGHHNNIQPKTILPSKVSNHRLKERDNLHKQKIEARKLRNREAALNSRLKKKEYLDNLESQVKRLGKENTDLMLENALLKQKIVDLEQEIGKFRLLDANGNFTDAASSRKKAKISFFAVAFMFLFQISPYLMSISPGNERANENTAPIVFSNKNFTVKSFEANKNHHFSRTLLWKTEETDNYFQKLSTNYNSSNLDTFYPNQTNVGGCEDYYNRTELIRLENELRGWLTRFKLEENESRRRQHSTSKSKKKLLYDLKHVPIPRLKLWMQKQRYMDYLNEELDHSFDDPFVPYDLENLMSTIHRRDDTFYYLSYPSKGHLILPPMSNRTDIRPRFSFLIPTAYNFSQQRNNSNNTDSNGQNQTETGLTLPNHHLHMLQIDCQVINTKVSLINMNHHHPYGSAHSKRKIRSSSTSTKPSIINQFMNKP
ncbi:bZIP_ATF6 domain-containing protein ATf6 [Dermatophagoides farinae]|uniref:bZIP_ATF6 domain-containing protein ATf6 n=1 Tax=Dermatophagoides farinae TaxID=6954 RepID=UPI003F632533